MMRYIFNIKTNTPAGRLIQPIIKDAVNALYTLVLRLIKTRFIKPALLAFILFFLSAFMVMDKHNGFVERIKNKLELFNSNKPFEKLYLHVDRYLYKPGENIWFSAYLTGSSARNRSVSDIIYVDFIGPKGSIEKSLRLQAVNGYCYGDFNIQESMPGGIYKIKAYTQWMKNFGESYFFEKEIQVQKVVLPRILSKLEFKKKAYGPSDKITAELEVSNLENEPLINKVFKYTVSLSGKAVFKGESKTDNLGKATIVYNLPELLETNDGLLNVIIPHEGNTESISRSIPIVLNNISLRFFPEGGYLVENVTCNVAFEALNEHKKPADIEGYVVDSKGKKVVSFSSFHAGMGSFLLKPEPGQQYYCRLTKPDVAKDFKIPEAARNGYTLKTRFEDETDELLVNFHSPYNRTVTVLLTQGNKILHSKLVSPKKGENTIKIPVKDYPSGLAMVTLFDHLDIPRCERLVFLNHDKRLNIEVTYDKEKYAPRQKVSMTIKTTDPESVPISARLSMAVVNDALHTMADDKQHNILSWLLLGSEIKGKIEEPEFYFNPDKPKSTKALDYLLLTRGWRRFAWSEINATNGKPKYHPENIGTVLGRVINKNTGEPVKAEVSMLELKGQRRYAKVNTDDNGRFVFVSCDVTVPIQLLAHAKKFAASDIEIRVKEKKVSSRSIIQIEENRKDVIPQIIYEKIEEKKEVEDFVKSEVQTAGISTEVLLSPDEAQLEEIVVIGYGTVKKKELTGAVSSIKSEDILKGTVVESLQGRVAGVNVVNSTGRPGAPANVQIRGMGSVTGSGPLYVVDGVPVNMDINRNASPLSLITADQVSSVEILKDAHAASLYGARASNGVIIITTKKAGKYGNKRITLKRKPYYTGIKIQPVKFSYVRQYYHVAYLNEVIPEVRNDFRSTIYWNPYIVTDMKGEAKVEFWNSDEITTFRTIIEGFSSDGNMGRTESKHYTQLPLSLDVKFPAYLTFSDTVNMPLFIKNNTGDTIRGALSLSFPELLQPLNNQDANSMVTILPDEVYTPGIAFKVLQTAGKGKTVVGFDAVKYSDKFQQEFKVIPKGFPTKISVSDNKKTKEFTFNMTKPVEGSVEANFTAYTSIIAELMSGIESILREPYGCFEQTSSSTYPNILILHYLQAAGMDNPKVSKRALSLIDKGYKRLIKFETRQDGFEWFGHVPPHDGLTAYGLMEFTDMQKVYNGVDHKMLKRTIDMLLRARDGKGGFVRNPKALDRFGGASDEVNNAYILYALTEAGYTNVEKEFENAYLEVKESKDLYRLCLVSNSAYNMNKQNKGDELILEIKTILDNKDWNNIQTDHSITRSYGKSLKVETASLYALAIAKQKYPDFDELKKAVKFIVGNRSYGGFGSTQATVLALKALTNFELLMKKVAEAGTIEVQINNSEKLSYKYSSDNKDEIIIPDLEKYLRVGQNTVKVKYLGVQEAVPYSFDVNWNTLTPNSNEECVLDLDTKISSNTCMTGETVRLTTKLSNKTGDGLPMSLAIVGIPSGLSAQTWQLKEIQDKNLVDYYEIRDNYIVFYYRDMAPGEVHTIHLDLKAEIAGTYNAPAGCAYLYYTNELIDWEEGKTIRVIGNNE